MVIQTRKNNSNRVCSEIVDMDYLSLRIQTHPGSSRIDGRDIPSPEKDCTGNPILRRRSCQERDESNFMVGNLMLLAMMEHPMGSYVI